MSITRRHLAAAGALAFAAASSPTVSPPYRIRRRSGGRKAVDDLSKAMMAADKAKALDALLSTS